MKQNGLRTKIQILKDISLMLNQKKFYYISVDDNICFKIKIDVYKSKIYKDKKINKWNYIITYLRLDHHLTKS